ncbi:MAG TPA: cobalamin-independent methionine synthase II family protein [Candidatus Polarisedimenticolaceae bacterium]|nr:cobalamin-independent methionine synthase II family protein [Candidatus Polarisedimenticolaceae bacterium]
MSALPLFPVTTVGSWPRPHALLAGQRAHRAGEISHARFEQTVSDAVRETVQAQHRAGVDLVTDGEQARDNFYSFVAEKLDGVRLMTLAEMLDHVEDKEGFSRLLDTLDVPAFAIRNPTCVGPLRLREPLALGDLERLRRFTDRPVKVTLPGPYLLTRAMWVPEVTRQAYPSKEALGEDVVTLLRDEIARLVAAQADFIQLDEPVLTELVFSKGQTRTFMCASLAARGDPSEELRWALDMLHQVLGTAGSTRTGLHVCRGNWSRDERTLLRGSYAPLATWLAQAPVTQLVLEYATPRAGEVITTAGKELGLGVVNPRTEIVERVETIVQRVEAALRVVPRESVFLNPDCGFGTFSARAVNDADTAERKLAVMVEAARRLR